MTVVWLFTSKSFIYWVAIVPSLSFSISCWKLTKITHFYPFVLSKNHFIQSLFFYIKYFLILFLKIIFILISRPVFFLQNFISYINFLQLNSLYEINASSFFLQFYRNWKTKTNRINWRRREFGIRNLNIRQCQLQCKGAFILANSFLVWRAEFRIY